MSQARNATEDTLIEIIACRQVSTQGIISKIGCCGFRPQPLEGFRYWLMRQDGGVDYGNARHWEITKVWAEDGLFLNLLLSRYLRPITIVRVRRYDIQGTACPVKSESLRHDGATS